MAQGQEKVQAIEARQTNCTNCKHQVMKAGFLAPRCRYPGRDDKLTPEMYRQPAKWCAAGNWLELPEGTQDTLLQQITERNRIVTEANRRGKLCDVCDQVKCAFKGCGSCRRRSMLQNPGMVCPADPPKWGAIVRERGAVKATWVFSVWNEPLIKDTLASFKASMVDKKVALDFLIIDDASDDGCCDNLPYPVIRNEKSLGIGHNLNVGTQLAIERGADVIGVSDPHMKIPRGTVEAHVWRALEEPCVVCSATRGWEEKSKMRQWGAYFTWVAQDCLAARWIGNKWPLQPGADFYEPEDEWTQVQIPLGAFYAYSRETVDMLREPTGRLWETPIGRWGFLLEPFSAKAYFLGIPILVSRDGYTRHFYRTKNPLPRASIEKVRNVAFGTASIFSEATWKKYFEAWCKTRGGVIAPEIDGIAAKAREGVVRSWTVEEEEEFLQSVPQEPEEKVKAKAIPFSKMLLPKRDKMMRARKASKKKK